jgi:hypothetical protein
MARILLAAGRRPSTTDKMENYDGNLDPDQPLGAAPRIDPKTAIG